MAVDVCEAEAAALGGGGELGVINAELVQDGAVVVGGAVGHAGLDAAGGHPGVEATRVMIAAVVVLGEVALGVGGAAKFSAPDDERVF